MVLHVKFKNPVAENGYIEFATEVSNCFFYKDFLTFNLAKYQYNVPKIQYANVEKLELDGVLKVLNGVYQG